VSAIGSEATVATALIVNGGYWVVCGLAAFD